MYIFILYLRKKTFLIKIMILILRVRYAVATVFFWIYDVPAWTIISFRK